ncbi:hypothetical protein [Bacillus cereus group sp. Bce001]|uniref:hypothetical protein n=1 Tax=Bacillus cereus group sp. Bce001 TaxID=3445260 RepID=UPI003F2813A0
MIEQVEIKGQLSIFDIDEIEIKLYEVLKENACHCEIRSYYLHNDYSPSLKIKPLAFRHGMKVRLDKEC